MSNIADTFLILISFFTENNFFRLHPDTLNHTEVIFILRPKIIDIDLKLSRLHLVYSILRIIGCTTTSLRTLGIH